MTALRTLGELESKIMHVLWHGETPATVREVHHRMGKDRSLAYTTVMTVMERLWRKGLLTRKQRGRAFEYAPKISEAQYTARLMHQILRGTQDPSSALAHFVKGIPESNEKELIRLAREAARRRRA